MWSEEWTKTPVTKKDLITRPGQNMEGMLLPRNQWTTINRIWPDREDVNIYYSNGTKRIM